MATVVLGVGTSHTPMLFTRPEDWPRYESRDRSVELLDRDGRPAAFEDLLARAPSEVASALTPESLERRHRLCQESLDRLARRIAEVSPDAVVVIGDDQKELFRDDNLPAILVYWGESLRNKERRPRPEEPSWWSEALSQYYGRGRDETHPVDSALARHVVSELLENDFDVAQSSVLPDGAGEGHAFAFVHSRLLAYAHVPVVPVFLNTYYPPNQPTPKRCFHLGRALRRAIESYPSKSRVAVVASGGLSHFVNDEELDRGVLAAIEAGDADALTSLPVSKLDSGTSEIRNWIAMYGATEHLAHEWSRYVPAYRTRAGTGTGCAFAIRR